MSSVTEAGTEARGRSPRPATLDGNTRLPRRGNVGEPEVADRSTTSLCLRGSTTSASRSASTLWASSCDARIAGYPAGSCDRFQPRSRSRCKIVRRRRSRAANRTTANSQILKEDRPANRADPSMIFMYAACSTSSASLRSPRQQASAHPTLSLWSRSSSARTAPGSSGFNPDSPGPSISPIWFHGGPIHMTQEMARRSARRNVSDGASSVHRPRWKRSSPAQHWAEGRRLLYVLQCVTASETVRDRTASPHRPATRRGES